ncbi:MAG: NADH-quinone oxidoreductase subunit E [Ahrensia sp.]
MSVRRLADDAVQPEGFKFNAAMAKEAKGWIKKYPKGREQSAVIPLLMLAQEQEGWVTKASIEHMADMLNMPLIRVMEVATFYTQFMLAPVGKKAHIQICGTTPCMLRGSEELIKVCKSRIHEQPFHLNEEGTLSWEEVECQGACVNAPMVMIFKDTYEDLTAERLEEIIDAFEAGKGDEVPVGPQIDRVFSAPAGGLTTLNGEVIGKPKKAVSNSKNATMKIAETASKAGETATKSRTKNKPAVDPVASRLSAVGDDKGPSTVRAKPSSKRKKAEASIGTDMGTTLDSVKAASNARKATQKPTAKTVGKSNPTMNIAATASGRAKPADKKAGPMRMEKPDGQADDLKLISGVGPKLEKTLNGLGFWHFHQIAKWTKKDVAIVDDELSFKGRIERDDWIKQAKALAKGGRDEYVKVFGKEPR